MTPRHDNPDRTTDSQIINRHLRLVPPLPRSTPERHHHESSPRVSREQLIHDYLPLAHRLARRFYGRGQHRDDLHQVALLGLVKAADGFDSTLPTPFPAYAVPSILGELRRYFRDYGWTVRVPRRLQELQSDISTTSEHLTQTLRATPAPGQIAKSLGVGQAEVADGILAAAAYRASSLDAPVGSGNFTLADSLTVSDRNFHQVECRLILAQLVPKLPATQRKILGLRFFHQLTQAEIAHELGLTQMQVCRLLARTLRSLRDQMGVSATDSSAARRGNAAS